MSDRLIVHPEVREALAAGGGVVALESTIIARLGALLAVELAKSRASAGDSA